MAKKTTTQVPPKTFEEALRELEGILADIEGGELGLEESLQKYERGNFLILHCRGVLSGAEKQIELLSRGPDGGLAATSVPLSSVSTDAGGGKPSFDPDDGAEDASDAER